MKIIFVHGALVFDGAWWHRMVEPLGALGLGISGRGAAELRSLREGSGQHLPRHSGSSRGGLILS
jgi:hypothetical protein